MTKKKKREAFMLTAIKHSSILLHITLIGVIHHGATLTSLNEMDQCVLCSYCDPPYKEINESRHFCTDTTNVPNLKQSLEFECHHNGDFSDLIYQHREQKISDISIIPPEPPSKICYFNISYYNISRASFVEDDTVFLVLTGNKTKPSVKKKWNVIDAETHMEFKFRVVGLTGR